MEETNVITSQEQSKTLTLRRIHLRVTEGPDTGTQYAFDHDVIQIGSKAHSDVCLSDDTVSRNHAVIRRTKDGIVLRDLESTNGTFVGPVRIREIFLSENKSFRVGLTTLAFDPQDEIVNIVPLEDARFEQMVGQSVAMREVFSILERVATTDLTVLILGETGTGKELVSAAVHARSKRKRNPFVVLDCGAVQPNLIESELFGHERGAFTGAVAPRAGVFEQAHTGTLFIDELGELPLSVQPSLLRVLEQREVRRVGGRRVTPVDVRIVAATNRDLQAEVAAGRFREDLYYRLAVVETRLPPLRERTDDFSILVHHLLSTTSFDHSVTGISADVLDIFQSWHWPGNVRELRNVLLRAIPFCDEPHIGVQDLPQALRNPSLNQSLLQEVDSSKSAYPGAEMSFKEARDLITLSFERQYLEDLLARADGNLTRAASIAGIDRKTVGRMLKKHGMK